jgi:putative transposase
VHRRSWPTKAELRTAVFEYITVFYNRIRPHSTLGKLSSLQFETLSNIPLNKENQIEAVAA